MIKIRLRPKPRSRYFVDLKVFNTKKELIKKRKGFSVDIRECEACSVFGLGGRWRIGDVWCYKKSASPDLLAHEFVHIGIEYLRRLKVDDLRERVNYEMPYAERPEEILCYAVQNLLGQAMFELDRAGISI